VCFGTVVNSSSQLSSPSSHADVLSSTSLGLTLPQNTPIAGPLKLATRTSNPNLKFWEAFHHNTILMQCQQSFVDVPKATYIKSSHPC